MTKVAKRLRQSAARLLTGLLLASGLVLSLVAHGGAQMALKDLVSIPRGPGRSDNVTSPVELLRIDPNTGETLPSFPIQLPGLVGCNLRGGNGLAVNPLTEELFALLNCGANEPRLLAIIDTFDGNATIVGDTGDFFAGLAFADDGTLFAITGDRTTRGDEVFGKRPNTLFIMSTTDATVKVVCSFEDQPNVQGGQAIAFNPDDGLLYHASGNGGLRVFESIDDVTPRDPLAPCPVTRRGPTGADYVEATALVYSGSSFSLADLADNQNGKFYSITSAGVTTLIGAMDHLSKGLAFINGPAEVCYKVNRDGAAASNQSVQLEDSIVGPRSVLLKLKNAFTVCVPGGLRFTSLSPLAQSAGGAEGDSLVKGRICYRVKNDDSPAANKTELDVEDQAKGERRVRIKTRKAFVVCDRALINPDALP